MIVAISSIPAIDINNLAEQLAHTQSLQIVENPLPLICKEYGFQTLYDMPRELQTEIREKLIREHFDFVKTNDNVLLKFSIFEYLADWMRWAWSNTSTEKWEEILSISGEIINYYTEIYHVDKGDLLEYDGYVWFDERNAAQINSLLKHLYKDFGVLEKIRS